MVTPPVQKDQEGPCQFIRRLSTGGRMLINNKQGCRGPRLPLLRPLRQTVPFLHLVAHTSNTRRDTRGTSQRPLHKERGTHGSMILMNSTSSSLVKRVPVKALS